MTHQGRGQSQRYLLDRGVRNSLIRAYLHYGDGGAQEDSYLTAPTKEVTVALAGGDADNTHLYAPPHMVLVRPELMRACVDLAIPWWRPEMEKVTLARRGLDSAQLAEKRLHSADGCLRNFCLSVQVAIRAGLARPYTTDETGIDFSSLPM